jgi:hypothetical protein
MNLELQLPSFLFGLLIGVALMLVAGQSYRLLFGGRQLRKLAGEVNHLRRVVEQKDHYIRKSLESLKKEGIEVPQSPTSSTTISTTPTTSIPSAAPDRSRTRSNH